MPPLMPWIMRRAMLSVLVLWGVVTATFIGMHLLPGDPAQIIAGAQFGQTPPDVLALINAEYGFQRPLLEQYMFFLGHLIRGDFGSSYQLQRPVIEVVGRQLGSTISLTAAATGIAVALAAALSLTTADRRAPAAVVRTVNLMLVSTPSFWVGILLLEAFSFRLRLFPVVGNQGLRSLVLPSITLALPFAGALSLLMSEGLERALEQPFALTVRARGATWARVKLRHAMRHALLPTLTLAGRLLGELLGGVVVVEAVFARQGIGQVALTAVDHRDFPTVIGVVVLVAAGVLFVNAAVDLLYRAIDPRIRGTPL